MAKELYLPPVPSNKDGAPKIGFGGVVNTPPKWSPMSRKTVTELDSPAQLKALAADDQQTFDVVTNEGKYFQIPLGKLRPSPFNVRKVRTPDRIQEIAQTLQEKQRDPITVYEGTGQDAGFFMIVSGVTRYMAAMSVGMSHLDAQIDASIDPSDPLTIVRVSHLHNDTATETDLDHAFVARDLQVAGYTLLQVAAALGYKGNRQITRLNAYFDLPEVLLDIGKTRPDKFSAPMAEIFKGAAQSIGEDAAITILKTALSKDLSRRDIEKLIDVEKRRIARDTLPRTRSTRIATQDFKVSGEKVGTMTVLQTSPGKHRIQLDTTLAPEMAEQLSEQLGALLKKFSADMENA